MKSKGAVKVFAIALTLVCAYQLYFTWVTHNVENDAKEFARKNTPATGPKANDRFYIDSVEKVRERSYLDSMGTEKVFFGYTYQDCKERELNLGLDLQGGMNVTLEVSLGEMVQALSGNNPDPAFNQALALATERLKTSQKDFVTLFGDAYKEINPNGKLSGIFATKENKDHVNFNTSNEDVLKFISAEANQAIDRSFEILRSRIDKFGVTQPSIQKLGSSGRILVELPGVDNPERVRKLLQGSARLQFWETYENTEAFPFVKTANDIVAKKLGLVAADSAAAENDTTAAKTESLSLLKSNAAVTDTTAAKADTSKKGSSLLANKKDSTAKQDTSKEKSAEEFRKENPLLFTLLYPFINDQQQLVKGPIVGIARIKDTAKINTFLNMPEVREAIPADVHFLWAAKPEKDSKDGLHLYAIRASKDGGAALEGDVITDARKDLSQTGNIEIGMSMNTEGASLWKKLTGKNVGKYIAIVLDDRVYSAPVVQNEIPNGRSSINGNFDQKEADDLANILKSGKLPAPTRIVAEAVVGPTLGQEAISAGFLSFAIALMLVLLFMGYYYNKAGWVADVALFVNVFFVVGVLASLGAVLTLPGIAGVVLTIGMSVDANILIFERVREEMHRGKALKNAVSEGFAHAMSSILDSNVTTLLLGIVLYVFGTGPIQGFATTLIIGILTSLFCAIFITRIIFDRMLDRNKDIPFWRKATENVFKNINIDFVGKRKLYYMFSGTIILIGVAFYAYRGGFNMGVDFKGGRTYVVRFENAMETQQVRETLKGSFGSSPEVKTYGESEQMKITTSYLIDDNTEDAEKKVRAKLDEGLGKINVKYEVMFSQKVGETISSDIKSKAIMAVLFSCLIMFIYIIIRFKKWQYGLGAVAALFHDVLIVLSIFLIFDGVLPFSLEIDQHFIAAILTVMGYSMTDTVVVFDRIREYLAQKNKSELDRGERNSVINYALNSTLSRTINTSLTIFFVLLAIFLFGGETIQGFSFALLIGIVIGTYSSICVATPIVVDFESKEEVKK